MNIVYYQVMISINLKFQLKLLLHYKYVLIYPLHSTCPGAKLIVGSFTSNSLLFTILYSRGAETSFGCQAKPSGFQLNIYVNMPTFFY